MKTLYLLRHATAEQTAPTGLTDHERALTPQGAGEAAAVGGYLQGQVFPSLVLCSSSTRTMQTVQAVYDHLPQEEGLDIQSHFDRGLYLAPPDILLALIGETEGGGDALLVAAHNPGIAELAHILSRGTLSDFTQDFAPATLAVFRADVKIWREIAPETVTLEAVFTP